MKLIRLGTNGFFPTLGRQTQCFLVLEDDAAILLDGGTGVGRPLAPEVAKPVEGYDRLREVIVPEESKVYELYRT